MQTPDCFAEALKKPVRNLGLPIVCVFVRERLYQKRTLDLVDLLAVVLVSSNFSNVTVLFPIAKQFTVYKTTLSIS